jgi:hypothetical protein
MAYHLPVDQRQSMAQTAWDILELWVTVTGSFRAVFYNSYGVEIYVVEVVHSE